MYSREASKRLRQDFWTAFGKSFPRKWLLYQTKVKGLAFRFEFDLNNAMVCFDLDIPDPERKAVVWSRLLALRGILMSDYLPEVVYSRRHGLENGKEISRMYVALSDVSVHDKKTWQEAMNFLYDRMDHFERFYDNYAEVIQG